MSEFDADLSAPFQKGTIARATLLDLVPRVDRVDGYAGSKYKSQLEPIRLTTDDVRQHQRELAVDGSSIIDTWLMIHESANDPDLLNDIISECTNMMNMLNKNNSKANALPEQTQRLAAEVERLKTSLGETIKEKDKVIDLELEEASKAVSGLDAQITNIDAELKNLRDQLDQGNIGKLVDAGKDLASKLGSKSSTASTTSNSTGGDDNAAIKEKIRQLEAQRAELQAQLDTARERKRNAVSLSDARTAAKGTDPVGGANKAHMDLLSWNTVSGSLLEFWNGITREITAYQKAFQAKKDDPSDANNAALANEIKKVDSLVPKLKKLQNSLKDGAHNQ